jgi:4-oxalocrotonate tautomerase
VRLAAAQGDAGLGGAGGEASGYPRGSVVPIVTVQQSPRPLAQKRALVAAITEAFVQAYGVTPEQVQVFIQEVDDENWAKAGNLAADRPPHR